MGNMRFKVGDHVRIKSLDWYNENKDKYGSIYAGNGFCFWKNMTRHCGEIMKITTVKVDPEDSNKGFYFMENSDEKWTDGMIEGLVEEETLIERFDDNGLPFNEWLSHKGAFHIPDGYELKDENGNVINATKIVLEKKKKSYPKTFEECVHVLERENRMSLEQMNTFRKLIDSRNAYWKIAGEEMGLGKPWEPDYKNPDIDLYVIINIYNQVEKAKYGYGFQHYVLAFPTEEMRDAFKENFDTDLEICKEFL